MAAASEIRRATRVQELSKMSKSLLKMERRRVGIHVIYESGEPTKDELIADILEKEFPHA